MYLKDHPFLIPDWEADLVDRSWRASLVAGAARGDWAGFRYVFTYGAMWQALMAPFAALTGLTVGNILAGVALVDRVGTLVLTFLLVRWVVPFPWVRAGILAATSVFWLWIGLKPVIPGVIAAVAGRFIAGGSWNAVLVGLLVGLAQHVSLDAGVAAGAGWVAALLGTWWWTRRGGRVGAREAGGGVAPPLRDRPRPPLPPPVPSRKIIGASLGGWALFQAGCWVAWRMRGYDYLHSVGTSVAMAKNYGWAMALPFEPVPALLVLGLGVGMTVSLGWVAVRWWRRDGFSLEGLEGRTMMMLGALWVAALAQMKSAFVRSDLIHVGRGVFPAVVAILGTAAVSGSLAARGRRWVSWTLWGAGGLALLSSGAAPRNYLEMALTSRAESRPIPADYRVVAGQDLAVSPRNHAMLTRPVEAISSRPGGLYVFPYETIINVLAGLPDPGGVLQSYAAMGDRLQDELIAGLEKARPRWVLWQTDLKASLPVDRVPSVTRSSRIVEHLIRWYRLASQVGEGQFLLERRETPRLSLPVRTGFPPTTAGMTAEVGGPGIRLTPERFREPAESIFDLAVSVKYPPGALVFGKPAEFTVTYTFSGGEERTHRLVLEPDGQPHHLLLVPLFDQESLVTLFADHPPVRTGARFPDLVGVRIAATRMGRWTFGQPRISVKALSLLGRF